MTRTDAQREFDVLCIRASRMLDQAAILARLNGLDDIDIRKADASAGIAGVTFHKISRHGADASDFQLVEKDVLHIARKVEPLIEAIGSMTRENSYSPIDESAFSRVIEIGLENAISELRHAEARAADDMERV